MPSALHPRSRQTLSLFATTLAVSFLVIGVPHVLPCPAPRAIYAEGPDGRRRRVDGARGEAGPGIETRIDSPQARESDEARLMGIEKRGRECPVPKPRGSLGEALGFGKRERRREEKAEEEARR